MVHRFSNILRYLNQRTKRSYNIYIGEPVGRRDDVRIMDYIAEKAS